MNLHHISLCISEEFNLSQAESGRIVKYILGEISKDLAIGERIYFREFGAFHRTLRPAKKYRNMKTDEIETREPYLDIDFRPSSKLLQMINPV